MSRYVARGAQIFSDLFVLSASYWIAFWLRFELDLQLGFYKLIFFTWPYVLLLKYLVLSIFGVPRFSWRYVGVPEAKKIFFAMAVATGVLVVLRLGLAPMGGYSKFVVIPLGVLGMDFVLSFLGVAGLRFVRRIAAESAARRPLENVAGQNLATLLIGAGSAGVVVAREVAQNPHLGFEIVGFVDDNPAKIGTMIYGHKVLGDTESIGVLAKKHGAEQAVISLASAKGSAIRRIVGICEKASLPVKIIPGIYEILDGRVNLSGIREVTINDLLGRDAIELDNEAIGRFLNGKRVLVTGAGGSIGSELCRQVSKFQPEKIVLVEQAENALFAIHQEFLRELSERTVTPIIADVCDDERIEAIFEEHNPQVVFHAAAHKHVPMMEWNPGEAIKNNVFGTKTIADAAERHGVDEFVMISTDKAVNPTSIMGASKRVAELYIQALAQTAKTKFVAVRFGNVLGSAGSVIPTFKQQIAIGGPVTVTHPEMKRYFMTIPEACQLVMQAAAMGRGSEIFVLDMGEPVFIVDLAKDLIRLSGFSPEEIPILYSGLRPGEKLFEELGTTSENMEKTRHPKIFIGQIDSSPLAVVEQGLVTVAEVFDSTNAAEVRSALSKVVPEMREPDTEDTAVAQTAGVKFGALEQADQGLQ